MTPFDILVDETFKYNMIPCVVPELKSITVGGAISGVGIESSSFKYGFVHETVEEMEVLLSSGRTVTCTKNNRYKDLFSGIPNSYGTLGYILKTAIRLIPVKQYVKIEHKHFSDINEYFSALTAFTKDDYDFIDGVVFSNNEMYITLGRFTDNTPYTSNYKYMKIYFKSIRKRKEDYLSVRDYLWRWDTDWFWCSRVFGIQNPIIRFLFGKWVLNSRFYLKFGRINKRIRFMPAVKKLLNIKTESIIQDVEIPAENAEDYLKFHLKEIPVRPLWICPMRSSLIKFDLYKMEPESIYVNFGFWQIVRTTQKPGYYNKLIEKRVEELKGKKTLYSDSYYTEKIFGEIYNKKSFDILKNKYDPEQKFKSLYEKCVMRE